MRRRRGPPDHRRSTRSTTSTGSRRSGAERTNLSEDTNAHPCGAVCSVGAASDSERPTSAGVGTVEVPVPDHRAQPLRIAQRGESEAPDRALATLVVAVQELDREDPR